MTYSGENVVEHMMPPDDESANAVARFYHEIGWRVMMSENDQMITVVPPVTTEEPIDGLGYWRTESPSKLEWFQKFTDFDNVPSWHMSPTRLPRLMELIERPLLLPNPANVSEVFNAFRSAMKFHVHVPPRRHADRYEFRFADPLFYSVRIAGPKQET